MRIERCSNTAEWVCPLFAHSGHRILHRTRPLSGLERQRSVATDISLAPIRAGLTPFASNGDTPRLSAQHL